MYLKDPNTGNPSPTTTVFVIGALVAIGKLILAGIQIGSITIAPFTGVDFGAAIGALGAVYVMRDKRAANESEKQ